MAGASVKDRLGHISRSIAAIEGYWQGKTLADFKGDEALRSATERHLLIIAEAVKHVPEHDRATHPDIPWREIIGIGNILRHGYDTVDETRIWEVVQNDLSALRLTIEAIAARY